MDERLLELYNLELRHLRETAAEFGRDFPKIAGRLALDLEAKEICPDPYVERLLEGFAFLAARVHLKLDAEFPRFTQGLLETVYPDYLCPVPSMAIVKFEPEEHEGALAEGFVIKRGTLLRSQLGKGERTACTFSTAHDVRLMPLALTEPRYFTRDLAELNLPRDLAAKAALRLRLHKTIPEPFDKIRADPLILHIRGADELPGQIYEQIFAHKSRLVVQSPAGRKQYGPLLRADCIRRVGFTHEQALLPPAPRDFEGYRLLREYFAFPQRFLFFELTGFVAELMQPAFPELMESVGRVARVVKDEEHRYATTFLVAEKMFNDAIKSVSGAIPGAVSFKLYDTYGLAFDEQEEMAREHSLSIDREGFEREMNQQRDRARASWKGAEKGAVAPAYQKLIEQGRTKFLGYDETEAEARVVGLVVDGQPVESVAAGAHAELVLDRTPIYAESGGQVGDRGELYSDAANKIADVAAAFYPVPGLIVHRISTYAPIALGDTVLARVATPLRDATRRNHTATHLLHAALHRVLGPSAQQAGSLVEPERLRFDFSWGQPLLPEQLEAVETLVNQNVRANFEVSTKQTTLEEARAQGAMALFGEKYGNEVRVVSVADGAVSRELCGGCHVRRTGDIGAFKITAERGIAAGVRRIEAVTGRAAVELFQEYHRILRQTAGRANVPFESLPSALEGQDRKLREVEQEVKALKLKLAAGGGGDAEVQEVKGIRLVVRDAPEMAAPELRALADTLGQAFEIATTGRPGPVLVDITKDVTAAKTEWNAAATEAAGGGEERRRRRLEGILNKRTDRAGRAKAT